MVSKTKAVLFFVCFLITHVVGARETEGNAHIGAYKWVHSVVLQPCTINGVKIEKDSAITSLAGQKFKVIKVVEDQAVIQILNYVKRDRPTESFYKYNFKGSYTNYKSTLSREGGSQDYEASQLYFSVGATILEAFAVRDNVIGAALTAGLINFPFKFRPQRGNLDYSGAFNFGAGIGLKIRHRSWQRFNYSVLSGYSISNNVLDSSNTDRNQDKLTSSNNYTSFSFSLGGLVEYQRVQVGLFIGWDMLNKLTNREFGWKYQGKPWISVGFGFAIFSGTPEERVDRPAETTQGEPGK